MIFVYRPKGNFRSPGARAATKAAVKEALAAVAPADPVEALQLSGPMQFLFVA